MMLRDIVTEMPVPDIEVAGICDDSREIRKGDLFLAVPGARVDGRSRLEEAAGKGAVAALCEAPAPDSRHLPVIPVEKLSARLGIFASRFYGCPDRQMTLVVVTGTNGKTSFTHLFAQALGSRQLQCGLIGTMGHGLPGQLKEAGLTTPPAVDLQRRLAELLQAGCKFAVLEASSHGIAQHRLSGCQPAFAVLTNITYDHLDYHGTFANYRAAKESLFHLPGIQHAIVNRDDDHAEALIERLPESVNCVDFSSETEAAVSLQSARMHPEGMELGIRIPGGSVQGSVSLFGSFNVQNLLAVVATLVAMDWQASEIEAAFASLQPVVGRMDVTPRDGQPTTIVDYAHTPDALEKALVAVREHFPKGRLLCVFGCGGDRDRAKRPVMGEIAGRYADRVFVTSDNPRSEAPSAIMADVTAGISGSFVAEPDRAVAIRMALADAGQDDLVLVAGKGHEDYQELATGSVPFSDFEVIDAALHEIGPGDSRIDQGGSHHGKEN